MTDQIAGLPFWQLRFDAQGDRDQAAVDALVTEVQSLQVSDLVIFSHGWNNDQATAMALYQAWFSQLAPQLEHARTDRRVAVGLVGLFWPSQRWSDEPIPDFAATPSAATAGDGTAAVEDGDPAGTVSTPQIDAATLAALKSRFPQGAAQLDSMAGLLAAPPTDAALQDFMVQLKAFDAATAVAHDDGEGTPGPGQARMLGDEPQVLFERYAAALHDAGVVFASGGDGGGDDGGGDGGGGDGGGGEAGIGDAFKGIWNGAKEALRQLTYWQMKNTAGVVGQQGLGPLVGALHAADPALNIHLVGHSFGGRLVSYALAGLPDGLDPSPVKSVTLLEGAFSHFALADHLPFDASRHGALAGMQSRVDGPFTVCFSSFDGAVGRFYPLASIASGDDTSALDDRLYRWGGMGHDGAQSVGAAAQSLQGAGPGVTYPFATGKVLNIDASDVVCHGSSPAGAHSDIVHPELTWVVLTASRIVS